MHTHIHRSFNKCDSVPTAFRIVGAILNTKDTVQNTKIPAPIEFTFWWEKFDNKQKNKQNIVSRTTHTIESPKIYNHTFEQLPNIHCFTITHNYTYKPIVKTHTDNTVYLKEITDVYT